MKFRNKKSKQIGNFIIDKDEKAVEKLKAWKRLKDKAEFKFRGVELDKMQVKIWLDHPYDGFNQDLDLLFGGGDE